MPKRRAPFKRLRRRHPAHLVMISFAMVMFWWGAWTVLDNVFLHNSTISGVISMVVALIIFLIDDFRLSELE